MKDIEIVRAKVILEIAAEVYAFMGTRQKVLPDSAREMWTAWGKNYSITYNPSNENFFVESLHSQMVVQSIEGELDFDVLHAVKATDVEQFQAIREALAPYEFCRSQSPAETQRLAETWWDTDEVHLL